MAERRARRGGLASHAEGSLLLLVRRSEPSCATGGGSEEYLARLPGPWDEQPPEPKRAGRGRRLVKALSSKLDTQDAATLTPAGKERRVALTLANELLQAMHP